MKWWGKALGAAVGGLVGGPPGAFLGSALGHALDSSVFEFGLFDLRKAQQTFFEQTFAVMGYVAKADGRVSEREIAVAEMIMQQMRMGRDRRRIAIEQYNRGKSAGFDVRAAVTKVNNDCGAHPEMLRLFLEYLIESASADGQIADPSARALSQISQILGIPRHELLQMMARRLHGNRQSGSEDTPYLQLGIKPGASQAEVKRAYRRLMSQHHPDKLVAKGLPAEMLELAKDKTAEISAAYEQIKNQRGW